MTACSSYYLHDVICLYLFYLFYVNSKFFSFCYKKRQLIVRSLIHITNFTSKRNRFTSCNISTKVVKVVAQYISNPLIEVFNVSLSVGEFADNLKLAKVIPVYKADDKLCVNNYRPISVFAFSKVLERLVYDRLKSFLDKNNILTDKQYGFREKHSTCVALLNLIDQISEQIDSKMTVVGIFIDLSKAFDTIDHNILLAKLSFYGIRGIAKKWFSSYLTNRQQYVQIQHVASNLLTIRSGVPQGSILGPLLFLLYVNDMVTCLLYTSPSPRDS